MEKGVKISGMIQRNSPRKVVVTGPESTGKTTLAESISQHLDGILVPEYARSYVESLNRPYCYEDVEKIARFQIAEESRLSSFSPDQILIMDTWLIVTKVWFDLVYGTVPTWLETKLVNARIDLFLVCSPDLPWIPDNVRENGGEMRRTLFQRYCEEIEYYGFKYEIISGTGETRVQKALDFLAIHQLI